MSSSSLLLGPQDTRVPKIIDGVDEYGVAGDTLLLVGDMVS
jgi:hypothetical protein